MAKFSSIKKPNALIFLERHDTEWSWLLKTV